MRESWFPAPSSRILEILPCEERTGILGVGTRRAAPKVAPPRQLLRIERDGRGGWTSADAAPGEKVAEEVSFKAQFAALHPGPHRLRLAFKAIAQDAEGRDWNLVLETSLRVEDITVFVRSAPVGLTLGQSSVLTPGLLESWGAQQVKPRLRDALEAERGADVAWMARSDALPPAWWEKHLREELACLGLAFEVLRVLWENPSAEMDAQFHLRQQKLRQMNACLAREQELLRKQEACRMQHEEELRRIRDDQRRSEAEREHELELQRRYQVAELEKAKVEVERVRHEREREIMAHEAELARLQHFQRTLQLLLKPDVEKVSIRLVEARTRDIGGRRAQELRVNQSLAFAFTPPRSGWVTLLNLGTSGRTWLLVPNAYVAADRARLTTRSEVILPAMRSELLPLEGLERNGLGFLEAGPPGWECLALIVSAFPIAEPEWSRRAHPGSPFAEIRIEEIAALARKLEGAPANSWAAGLAEFLVVER